MNKEVNFGGGTVSTTFANILGYSCILIAATPIIAVIYLIVTF